MAAPDAVAPPPGYRTLLRTPGARAFTAAALVGRLPIAMLGIGTVLLLEDRRDSYALAGLVSAAYSVGVALLGPGVSRLVDRHAQRAVLPWALLLSAVGVAGTVGLAGSAAPVVVLLPFAALMGTAPSQLGPCARARWSALLADRPAEVPRAYAWEAVVDEVVFVLGPLVVVLAALLDPAVGLLAALGLAAVGTLWLVTQTATEPAVVVPAGRRSSALTSPGLRTLTVVMLFVGVLFGTVEVSMVAFAEERGSGAGAGVLLALVALGSAAAGLLYGARRWTTPAPRRLLLSTAFLAAGLTPLLLAPTVAAMVPAALLAGVAISPTLIGAFGLLEDLVPVSARTEGFSWLNSGLGVGVAGGFAVAGAVAEGAGARTAFLVALGGAVVATAVVLVGRRTLVPAPRPA